MPAPELDDREIMTLPEVADYLQLSEKTVLRLAQRGEIPAAKIASQWRFMRSVIHDWVAAQMQMAPSEEGEGPAIRGVTLSLLEVLRPELMRFDIESGPKEAVLAQLIEPLSARKVIRNRSALLAGLVERERMMSTAMGHAVAIPHPRRPIPGMFAEPVVVLGVSPKGVDFAAVDDQLVRLFFLIGATRDENHLQLMARVAWLARRQDVVRALAGATSADDVLALIPREP